MLRIHLSRSKLSVTQLALASSIHWKTRPIVSILTWIDRSDPSESLNVSPFDYIDIAHMAPTSITSRDELTSRILPQMVLSEGSNPLTQPISPPPPSLTSSERAIWRFTVQGNAIVTGGCGNLGLVAARALIEHGASGISLWDVHPNNDAAVRELITDFPRAKIVTQIVDVRDEQCVLDAIAQTVSELGSINMLLCFAGVVACTHALELSVDEWKRTLDINTTGSWLCAQAVANQMVKQRSGGSIIFTASISAHSVNFPQPQIAYNVSKGAILQLKNSLAAEWARYGIRVNSISPGYMDTVLNHGPGLEEARHVWTSRNPMGRMGDPEELAGVVVLLCSHAGRYINGADIIVDGEPEPSAWDIPERISTGGGSVF